MQLKHTPADKPGKPVQGICPYAVGNVRSGDVLHSRGCYLYSWAIRHAVGSWGNHDAVIFCDSDDRWWSAEALFFGRFEATPLQKYLQRVAANRSQVVFYRQPDADDGKAFETSSAAAAAVGTKSYDKLAILRIWLKLTLKLTIRPDSEWQWYCTESVARLYHGTDAQLNIWGSDYPTPGTTERRLAAGRLEVAGWFEGTDIARHSRHIEKLRENLHG